MPGPALWQHAMCKLICACVCYIYVCVHVGVCIEHACARVRGGQRSTSGVFINLSPPYFLRQSFLLNPKFITLGKLAVQ